MGTVLPPRECSRNWDGVWFYNVKLLMGRSQRCKMFRNGRDRRIALYLT